MDMFSEVVSLLVGERRIMGFRREKPGFEVKFEPTFFLAFELICVEF
jgi:hypothetical protein